MRLFRICSARFAADTWTGEGAWRFGARWNSRHVRVTYTSTSLALAAMEFFVHLEPISAPDDLQACSGDLDDDVAIATPSLPPRWLESAPEQLQALGDDWVHRASSVALRVPSAAVPGEWNVLLNPAHPDFRRFRPHRPLLFRFDPRMFARR